MRQERCCICERVLPLAKLAKVEHVRGGPRHLHGLYVCRSADDCTRAWAEWYPEYEESIKRRWRERRVAS